MPKHITLNKHLIGRCTGKELTDTEEAAEKVKQSKSEYIRQAVMERNKKVLKRK